MNLKVKNKLNKQKNSKRFENHCSSKFGFTLIELLVVIAIIGILSSIVMTSLNSAREKAKDSARLSDLRQIQLALALYYDQNGEEYPNGIGDGELSEFLSTLPTDPDGADYFYTGIVDNLGFCSSYHLGGVLSNTFNSALDDDSDSDTSLETDCDGNLDAGFDGTNDATNGIYDIRP